MPSRLGLIALFLGVPLMLLGSFTNSWWSADQGMVSVGAGLKKVKICAGVVQCQSMSYSLFDAQMANRAEGDESVPGLSAPIFQASAGKSYAWAGTAVFWLSILGGLIALVFYKTASDDEPWRPAAIAAAGVVGVAFILALLFVIKKPNVMVRIMPLGVGYSMIAFFAGSVAIGVGVVLEGFLAVPADNSTWSGSDWQQRARRPSVVTQPPASMEQPTETTSAQGSARCQSCGGAAEFRKDVGCLVCKECGVLI